MVNGEYLIDKSSKKRGRKKWIMRCNRREGKLIRAQGAAKAPFRSPQQIRGAACRIWTPPSCQASHKGPQWQEKKASWCMTKKPFKAGLMVNTEMDFVT